MTKLGQTMKNEKQILIKKKAACKTQSFYILLASLLITIALLTVVSIYCCLLKYRAIHEHLLLFHLANNKLKI